MSILEELDLHSVNDESIYPSNSAAKERSKFLSSPFHDSIGYFPDVTGVSAIVFAAMYHFAAVANLLLVSINGPMDTPNIWSVTP